MRSISPSSSSSAILAAGAALVCAAIISFKPAPAAAYDDDVDVVCFEVAGETECSTIDQLTAECEKTDPEFTTDECQGLLQNRKPPATRLTADDDNRGSGDGRGDGGRGSGGNSGGGNSGGGNSGGGGKGAGGSAAGGGGMKSK
jgi:hypothetical protein